jgi:hypothetical protein
MHAPTLTFWDFLSLFPHRTARFCSVGTHIPTKSNTQLIESMMLCQSRCEICPRPIGDAVIAAISTCGRSLPNLH